MKRILFLVVVIALAGGVFYWFKQREAKPATNYYRSQMIRRGDVVQEVTATGTVNPIKKVNVTTQVTGKVISLKADYNSRVKAGETIALIDPDTYVSALASARAQLKSNQAALLRTQAQLTYAGKELERQKKMFQRNVTTTSELDAAQATFDELTATKMANEAAIEQSQAAVKTAETNLSYCTISSPVTGVVISRSVDEGETVVSNMSASALFTIATDLSRIEVEAAVPEADIGGIKVGQRVNFTVDAYKTKFTGTVTEIRLASTTTSNVVTYPVIVQADNPGEKLFPGMTANLAIITDEARDVVIVPAAALRFTPPQGGARSPAPGQGPAGAVPPPGGDRMQRSANQKTIWIAESDTAIRPAEVQLGISDSVNQALVGGEELCGQRVATGNMTAQAAAAMKNQDQPRNPFMPTPPKGRRRNGPPPRM